MKTFEIKLDIPEQAATKANEAFQKLGEGLGEMGRALARLQRQMRRKAARAGTRGRRGARAVGKWGTPYQWVNLAKTYGIDAIELVDDELTDGAAKGIESEITSILRPVSRPEPRMNQAKYDFLSEVVSVGHSLAEAHRLHDLAVQAATSTGAPVEEALYRAKHLALAAINTQFPAEKITRAMIELPLGMLDLQILEGARVLSEQTALRLDRFLTDTAPATLSRKLPKANNA